MICVFGIQLFKFCNNTSERRKEEVMCICSQYKNYMLLSLSPPLSLFFSLSVVIKKNQGHSSHLRFAGSTGINGIKVSNGPSVILLHTHAQVCTHIHATYVCASMNTQDKYKYKTGHTHRLMCTGACELLGFSGSGFYTNACRCCLCFC